MPGLEIAGATALVTGASRGFGRGIAAALSRAGAQVTGVARDPGPLDEAAPGPGGAGHVFALAAPAAAAGARGGRGVRRGLRPPGPGAPPGAGRPGRQGAGPRPRPRPGPLPPRGGGSAPALTAVAL